MQQPFYVYYPLLYLSLIGIVNAQDLFCSFQTDLCGFTQDSSDDGNWVRTYYAAARYTYRPIRIFLPFGVQNMPPIDHTYGNDTGYYMLSIAQGVSRLISPPQSPSSSNNNTVCFQFWYHMYGNVGNLNVYVRFNSSILGSPVFSLPAGTKGNIWRAAQIEVQENTTYQVVFECMSPNAGGYNEGIGIDDVMITNSYCRGTGYDAMNVSCSFESSNVCGYRQDQSDDFDWRIHNGRTSSFATGPSRDHTLGNALGLYMYIEASDRQLIEGHKARIISPVWNITEPEQCVEFWYHMYGSDTGSLSLFIQPAGGPLPAAAPAVRIVGHHMDLWLRATYLMNYTGEFELVFEAVLGTGAYGDISLDDVRIYDAPCLNDTKEPEVVPIAFHMASCDFEEICNYSQDIKDEFDWTRKAGSTTSISTGPTVDHTYGNEFGHYMYIETSYPRGVGETARLMTPILTNNNTGTCIFFYYHMYGRTIDFLKVYNKDIGGDLPVDPIFVKHGGHGNVWRSAKVDVAGQTEYFQIVFEGTVGRSVSGDIAIDDVQFYDTSCNNVKLVSEVDSTVFCDFEDANSSLCNFKQSTNDQFDWKLRKGSTESTETGPSKDHTYGNTKGHYMYIEASSPRRPYETARLLSPPIGAADHLLCFKFWYHMKGEHVGKLNLFRRFQYAAGMQLLWTMTGDQGDRWIEATLPINYNTARDSFVEREFQIIFVGVIGKGHLGDIAIDDISLVPHHCFPSGLVDTPATEFTCDFEGGITECGFMQDLSDVFDWKLLNVSDESQHTANYSTAIGRQDNFVYLDMTGREKGDIANIATVATPSNGTRRRCLTFSCLLQGDEQQQLNVYTVQDEGAIGLVGTVTYKNSSEWKQLQFDLPDNLDDSSKIMFEGVVGFEPIGFIALDDVTVKIGACIDEVMTVSKSPSVIPVPLQDDGDSGIGTVATAFISLTLILLFSILLSVAIMSAYRKYVKKSSQANEHFHYSNDQNISSDMAVDNPAYEITTLGNA